MDYDTHELLAKFNRLDREGKALTLGFITGYLMMMERGDAMGDRASAKTDYG